VPLDQKCAIDLLANHVRPQPPFVHT